MKSSLSLHTKQMEVYRSNARFRVVVAGRRWGKCLVDGTLVSMADGSEKPVECIVPGDIVITINEDTYGLESRPVLALHNNGVRETVLVKTSGRLIRSTPNHPHLVNNTWVEAKDIKVGDLIAVPKYLAFGNESMSDSEIDILAIWLAEGRNCTVSNTTPEILDLLKNAARNLGGNLRVESSNGVDWSVRNGDRTDGSQAGTKNPMRKLLERHKIWSLDSKTKFIPDSVFKLREKQLARFLNRFIACDGSIAKRSKNTWSLEIGLANERMVRQLSSLLHKFGIRGQVRHKVHKSVSKITGKNFESWTLVVSDSASIVTFADKIGAISKESQVRAAKEAALMSRGNSNAYIPVVYDDYVEHLVYEPKAVSKYGGYNCAVARDLPEELRESLNSWRKQTRSRMSVKRYERLQKFSDGYFDSIVNGDIAWEEVISVEDADEAQTWDLSVEGNHNFVANGVVTHNTALSRVLIIKKAQKRNQKIWYVAPTYRMAKQIMWTDLLDAIPKPWIKKINETTLSILLVNGTRIELKGADKADSLRGVGIHFLVLDEFQDMAEETWTQVLRPTLADTGGHAIFIGTPKAYNQLYELYKHGQDEKKVQALQWESWQFPTITSPFIPYHEIEAARRDMDPKSFRQEFEACHLPETEVLIWGGKKKAIKDVKPGDTVVHLGPDGNLYPCPVLNVGVTGIKPITAVVLETGETVTASNHHKFKIHVNE